MPGRPRKQPAATEDASLKATTVAVRVLMEGKPLTLRELTLEVQRRGCRSADDYRVVSHAINSGLRNYRRFFRRDAKGRWVNTHSINSWARKGDLLQRKATGPRMSADASLE